MSSTYPPFGGSVVRPCARCGKPLQPNEIRCSNCGYQNIMPMPNGPTSSPSNASQGMGTPPGPGNRVGQPVNPLWSQTGAPSSYPPQQAPGPSVPPIGTPSIQPFPQATGPGHSYTGIPQSPQLPQSPQPAGNPGNYYGPPGQPARSGMPGQAPSGANFYGSSSPRQPAYPAVSPPPQSSGTSFAGSGKFASASTPVLARRNDEQEPPRIGVLIAIIVLIVILVGGGGGAFLYLSAHHSGTTATTIKPTPTPNVTPLFADNFAGDTNAWDLQSVKGKYAVAINNGALTLEDDDNHLLWELLPGNRTFTDFHLSVNAALSKGDQNNGYGIYIRGASNQNTDLATYYRFEIYGDGTYAIFKGAVDATGNSSDVKLAGYTYSSAIYPQGKVNHIEIVAHGASMTLIVNGQTIKTITDTSYTSGTIALFVSNLQGSHPGAQATFSNFVIYPFPD